MRIVSEIVYMRNFYSMIFNLRMTVERSKRRSYFLSLVFITKCLISILRLSTCFCAYARVVGFDYSTVMPMVEVLLKSK